jgi:hypothetical protein
VVPAFLFFVGDKKSSISSAASSLFILDELRSGSLPYANQRLMSPELHIPGRTGQEGPGEGFAGAMEQRAARSRFILRKGKARSHRREGGRYLHLLNHVCAY